MRTIISLTLVASGLLQACDSAGQAPPARKDTAPGSAAVQPSVARPAAPTPVPAAARWDLQASGEGTALALMVPSGATALRLFCPARQGQLTVNVPGFRPVASEERLSFGSGGVAVALVADPGGDKQRGGITATGPVPSELAAALAGKVSVSYGAQSSGPNAPPPPEMVRAFVADCRESAAPPPPESGRAPGQSPCAMQGSQRLTHRPLRAVGTEPFWGVRIEGRCVTYSHPEDQKGTRIWTRYTAGANGAGRWSGTLAGKPFDLRIVAAPGCSDGMSDRKYPLSVELRVNGEARRGCAEPS